jgi:diketogulonate reductase-like aldo/keto reductase
MIERRRFLTATAGAALWAAMPWPALAAGPRLTKTIPKSGEKIGAVGMGSWITFNVGGDMQARAARTEVLRAFFAAGGGMIDSSPMYGSSEDVIGHCLAQLNPGAGLFSATKVWTSSKDEGREQFADSLRLWRQPTLDLYQIHNLLGWEGHLETLKDLKAAGKIRYLGITTSHGRRHRDLERIISTQPFDFVQLSYSAGNRDVEARLLPAAADNGVAVIANRPYQRRYLIERVSRAPLPGFAAEIGCRNWPQLLLKFVISHPAITTAIPATSQVPHMVENMATGIGPMPDAAMRKRIADAVDAI